MIKSWIAALAILSLPLAASAAADAKAVLDVKGMHCATCPLTVKTLLKKQPGVEAVRVDARENTATVEFDSRRVTPEQLAKAVSDAGYPAQPRK